MAGPQGKQAEFAVMLRSNATFGDLGAGIIEALARLCSTRTLAAGATLCQRGDPGDAMYGIRRGQVLVQLTSSEGRQITLATLVSGDLVGEIAVLDGGGRTADIVAAEATELFVLRRADLLADLEREPRVAIKLMEMVCRRLRATNEQLRQANTQKLDARLAGRLVALAADLGETIDITQEQLARYFGATRESINRQLQAWQGVGLVEVKRGRIVVKDEARLRAISRTSD